MSVFEIDADIRGAWTISADFYTDPVYFTAAVDRIFARSWQFLCHVQEVQGLHPITILRGVLDEPVLLVKTAEWLTCLSNVCTHRGKVLVESACRADLIRCPYHGRRFLLDGSFLSMPEFEDVKDFPTDADNLRKLPLAERGGFLFTAIRPDSGFEEYADDALSHIPDHAFAGIRLTERREYPVDAHWALYCENYLEGFHIPYVHQGLNAVVDYGKYTTELFEYSSLQTALDKSGEVAARYLFIFPNLMFNFYPWGISVNIVRPVAHDRTVVEFLRYVRDQTLVEEGAGADLHAVELEDEAVVESVQRGIRSRFYTRGRYSPKREQGTHHFHRLIARFMTT
jgi:choline monooxygenase